MAPNSPHIRNQKRRLRSAWRRVTPLRVSWREACTAPERPLARIARATSASSSRMVTQATSASSSSTPPNARKPHCQPPSAIIAAASGGMVRPPALLPAVTAPITRPRVAGNHSPTSLPAGSVVAPGKPAYTRALNRYQCHSESIRGRSRKPAATRSREITVTGRAPQRSAARPITGATTPEMTARVSDRLSSVWLHPKWSRRGAANSPKAYWLVPMVSPVERNTTTAMG